MLWPNEHEALPLQGSTILKNLTARRYKKKKNFVIIYLLQKKYIYLLQIYLIVF